MDEFSITPRLVAVGICILLSAFFSGSETAITSLGDVKIRHMAESYTGRIAKAMRFSLEHPTRVLSTILIGNNLVNILASGLATEIALHLIGSAGVAIATGVMTLLVLIFAEITPKSFAKANAERVVAPVLLIIRAVYFGLYPFVMIFGWLADRMIGKSSRDSQQEPQISEEELHYYIRLSKRGGGIPQRKEEMLTSLLVLKETKVHEVMVPRPDVSAISVEATVKEARELIIESGHSRIPVYKDSNDQIVGLIHALDLLGKDDFLNIEPFLREPMFVYENKNVDELMEEMKRDRQHLAVVLDEYGSLAGLVSLEDVLEEFVGDIQDEYDDESQDFEKLGKNRWRIDGLVHRQDFEEHFKVQLEADEQSDYNTMGGFVLSKLGRIPKKGETVRLNGFTLTVENVTKRRIMSLIVKKTIPAK